MVMGAVFLFSVIGTSVVVTQPSYAAECGGRPTAIISCEQNDENPTEVEDTGIWGVLILIINVMTAGIGVLAVAGFVYGGILYITSGGSPEQAKKARSVFLNVAVGVIAFGAMFALLNFLVPGGVFN